MSAQTQTWMLLHGSFHGGWCWERLAPHLHGSVIAPTFHCLGENAETGLAHHIDQVAARLSEIKADTPITIVAHSYAGMVLPGALAAADVEPKRSVFLDAFVPEAGECAFDHLGPMADVMRASAVGGFMMPPPAEAFGLSEADASWASPKLKPMPERTHSDQSPASAAGTAMGECHFIRCAAFKGFASMEARAHDYGWATHRLDAGHDAMVTHPAALAKILNSL